MKKRSVGRPTDYNPKYCQGIIDYMKDGKFKIQYAVEIGVCESTIYEWAKKHDEFSKSIRIAEECCKAWWINHGVDMLDEESSKHDSRIYSMFMNNMHGWGDKQKIELTGKDGGDLNLKLSPETVKELNAKARAENKRSTGRTGD
jgi:regulator of sigma D